MDLDELDYTLPESLIAQEPPEARDGGRMLVLDPGRPPVHARIPDLVRYLERPTLVVLNNTRVIPARLFGEKPTGGRVELLLVERLTPPGPEERWTALTRASKPLRPGTPIRIADGLLTALLTHSGGRTQEIQLVAATPGHHGSSADAPTTVSEQVERVGQVPLPPYIRRAPTPDDRDRYQTVFARVPGAVAAPTAGLHLTPGALDALRQAGHELAMVTLHVGPGTFAPIRTHALAEHRLHAERYCVPPETAEAIVRSRADRRPVLAVGTTVVRTLEAAATDAGLVCAGEGETSLFIYPPFRFRVVDMLLTNFHLPQSSLLALVMAFGGVEPVRRAYVEAVAERYRFFSYGDAMLLRGPEGAP